MTPRIERCFICDEATGRAGRDDDSLYDDDGNGPYCEQCWEDGGSRASEGDIP